MYLFIAVVVINMLLPHVVGLVIMTTWEFRLAGWVCSDFRKVPVRGLFLFIALMCEGGICFILAYGLADCLCQLEKVFYHFACRVRDGGAGLHGFGVVSGMLTFVLLSEFAQ